MKTCTVTLLFFIIMTTNLLAQRKAHITIFSGSRESSYYNVICELDFDRITIDSVGDDYLYMTKLYYLFHYHPIFT
jgi:hypothetical protein